MGKKPNIVLGLPFFSGSATDAQAQAHGLCMFPSGPGLSALDTDRRYRDAVVQADVRFADSGFLALFWFIFSGQRLSRISGLRFLKDFINSDRARAGKILWLHPTPAALERNQLFLENEKQFSAARSVHTLAPIYPAVGKIEDPALLQMIVQERPDAVVINIGSGFQEPLGAYLKEHLQANSAAMPLILCTGGAIDLLTGAQAPIPDWADRLYLGWLFRILTTPPKEAAKMRVSPSKRYLGAWRLLGLLWKWRDRLPE